MKAGNLPMLFVGFEGCWALMQMIEIAYDSLKPLPWQRCANSEVPRGIGPPTKLIASWFRATETI